MFERPVKSHLTGQKREGSSRTPERDDQEGAAQHPSNATWDYRKELLGFIGWR